MNTWDWEPSVIVGCAALAIGYIALVRKRGCNRAPYFLPASFCCFSIWSRPSTPWPTLPFQRAHRPAFPAGAGDSAAVAARHAAPSTREPQSRLERVLGQPPVSWLLGVGTMLAWHIPALFNAALAQRRPAHLPTPEFPDHRHDFLVADLGPLEDRHLSALGAVSYLFSACVCCSLLGAFLTFGPVGLYPAYLNPPAHPGGLDPKSDQQLGGMLMWVPGCFVYLSGILSTVLRVVRRGAHRMTGPPAMRRSSWPPA